jgi:hypothetical protein
MKKLAINIQPLRVSKKTRGFSVPAASARAREAVTQEKGGEEVALAR